ncbi:hypothetical protein G5B35_09125 [Parapusillimonas sp. SGNA-6]|nr:hypothetical protein [Parapusillimonas sp. SGNA-6]
MNSFWLGALIVVVCWVFFSFRKNANAASAFAAADEAAPWMLSRGIEPQSANFSSYNDPHLLRNAGSTVLVGMAKATNGETIGFGIEVMAGRGVVSSEILTPYGVASWHRSAAMEARATGLPLLDVLKAKSRV